MNSSPIQRREDKGFTLIELMVVVLIIAILLAIAIPTFLGAQNKAKDRSAQSSARNALTNAKTLYADTGSYIGVDDAALRSTEPSLTFLGAAAPSTGPKEVSVMPLASGFAWYSAVMSATGTCFYLRDSIAPLANPGTMFAKVTSPAAGTCNATVGADNTKVTDAMYVAGW